MKISDTISYPYPILGWYDNYKTRNATGKLIEKLDDPEAFVYEMDISNNDDTITELVNSGKAAYACIATCSATFYNQFVTDTQPHISIRIMRDDVYGEVEIKFLIVATCDIADYQNGNLNDFYENSAYLPKGAAIAILCNGHFDATPTSGKKLGDVIKVVKNTWSDEIEYDCDNPCIRIALPDELYTIFKEHSSDYSGVLHSTIVQSAIMEGIYILPQLAHSDYEWVKYLKGEIENIDELPTVEELIAERGEGASYSIEEAMKISNFVLKNPIFRAFKDLEPANGQTE